jgi:hypothetical protein
MNNKENRKKVPNKNLKDFILDSESKAVKKIMVSKKQAKQVKKANRPTQQSTQITNAQNEEFNLQIQTQLDQAAKHNLNETN